MGDRGRLDQARCQLVEHGLETVVVVRVDEHDVRVRVLEVPRGPQTGEPAAEDDDPMPVATGL